MKISNETIKNLIVLGILSGMRANAGLLFTALLIRKQTGIYFSPSRLVKFFNNDKTLIALIATGVGETVMDKLPTTPARTNAGGLSGRMISGIVSGTTISKAAGRKPMQGAVISGLAALASTFAFYYLRKNISKATKIPDPYIGGAEDALAIAFGILLLKKNDVKEPKIIS